MAMNSTHVARVVKVEELRACALRAGNEAAEPESCATVLQVHGEGFQVAVGDRRAALDALRSKAVPGLLLRLAAQNDRVEIARLERHHVGLPEKKYSLYCTKNAAAVVYQMLKWDTHIHAGSTHKVAFISPHIMSLPLIPSLTSASEMLSPPRSACQSESN